MRRAIFDRTRSRGEPLAPDAGFTLVELMVVVLIIGILVSIAIPVFNSIKARAQLRTCFANQRTIQSAASMWKVDSPLALSALAGPVDATSPLMNPLYMARPPRCPSAPEPADPVNPVVGEGVYSIDASGSVEPCLFGNPAHGSFYGP